MKLENLKNIRFFEKLIKRKTDILWFRKMHQNCFKSFLIKIFCSNNLFSLFDVSLHEDLKVLIKLGIFKDKRFLSILDLVFPQIFNVIIFDFIFNEMHNSSQTLSERMRFKNNLLKID
ncbi:hypothetical protein BpHYR1_015764 [Brachionus plicatilis]|uniref:Uncharacterized protein n=1 Tax=Brachionus plicatilis TaxID=10195 RepID=A0A3M7Q8W4_BRAPC|nr:hypothetical protein BpHYR1_015764 [Brachionus plicatilis]